MTTAPRGVSSCERVRLMTMGSPLSAEMVKVVAALAGGGVYEGFPSVRVALRRMSIRTTASAGVVELFTEGCFLQREAEDRGPESAGDVARGGVVVPVGAGEGVDHGCFAGAIPN